MTNAEATNTEQTTADLIAELNGDLQLEFQSIVQYVQHVTTITGPEYTSIVDELKVHLGQELKHAMVLAEQVGFLGGTPTTTVHAVQGGGDARASLQSDLALETEQLERYRERVFTPTGTDHTHARHEAHQRVTRIARTGRVRARHRHR